MRDVDVLSKVGTYDMYVSLTTFVRVQRGFECPNR